MESAFHNVEHLPNSNLGKYLAKGRWVKGESGNPSGVSGKTTVSSLLKQMSPLPVAEKLYSMAISGNIQAMDIYLDRTEGKVASEVNLKGLMIHVGDDYARQGIEAMKLELEDRRAKYLLASGDDASQ